MALVEKTIAFIGAGSGLVLGFLVSWLQKTYGFISMDVESAVSPAYPVKIIGMDFFYTAICIIVITFLASIKPANTASSQSAQHIL